jgi:hypothetical protein
VEVVMPIQTEFEFVLPRGYVDGDGQVHRKGVMRLATAMDEIAPLRDPRVKANEAYLTIILLSRVITQLGALPSVTTKTIESLYAADLAYLQDLYRRINEEGVNVIQATCPSCGHTFETEVVALGGE